MKKILFISHTNMLGAGTSRSMLLLFKYIKDKYEIIVVSPMDDGELPRMLENYQIPCFQLPVRTIIYLPTLIYMILTNKIDLVYGNNFSGRCEVALWAAKLTRRPFIWHIRESLTDKSIKRSLSLPEVFVANSEDTALRILKYVPNKKVFTIANGIELDEFNLNREKAREYLSKLFEIPTEKNVVINVGMFCFRKNQLDVIETAFSVVKDFPNTIFMLIGNFLEREYFDFLNHRIAQLGLHDYIRVVNFQSNIIPFMRGSDLLLHTARIEPQGRVILEAMAAQLPVVAYNVGGVGEAVVNEETGYLVPFGDISALVKMVKKLISDSYLRHNMGEKGYLRVKEHFVAEQTATRVSSVIDCFLPTIL